MKFPEKEITSVNDLISEVYENLKDFNKPIWYRGHPDSEYKLEPTIFRLGDKYNDKLEMNLIKKFRQNATLLIDTLPTNNYEWLFIMRHNLVPTRLLDWTESLLVGLYFAVNSNAEKNATLWALSPIDLNKVGGRELDDPDNLPAFGYDSEMENYYPENVSRDRMTKLPPIAFIAPRNSERMQVQLSVFTIFHRDKKCIEDLGDKTHIWKYNIPMASKIKIKEELNLLSITEFQLFPELSTLGKCVGEI